MDNRCVVCKTELGKDSTGLCRRCMYQIFSSKIGKNKINELEESGKN